VWTSIVLFVAAAAFFAWSRARHPGREETVYTREPAVDDETAPRSSTAETSEG
jgi:hypothetical protein